MRALLFWLGLPLAAARAASPVAGQAPAATPPATGQHQSDTTAEMPAHRLQRTIAVDLRNISLGEALKIIDQRAQLGLAYTPRVVPVDRRVTLHADRITAGDALARVLEGTDVEVAVSPDGVMMLVRKAKRETSAPHAASRILGQVIDSATGRGIMGAEVFLEGTRWRTSSDSSGRYRLVDVDSGTYTLAARRLGYAKASRRIVIGAAEEDTIDLMLRPVVARLQELVSTATGPRRRLEVANDITTINADSVMQAAPIRSVTDLLENRVPGLTVQHTSGAPGDPSRLRLRGVGSVLRNNDPIVIVDGVRVYAEQSATRSGNLANTPGDMNTTRAYAAPSPLDYIDPNSIETIEVIKGPSAATLYGQDAANGVIVITTKKGKAGPTRWTMSAEQGRTTMEGDYPELLFRWGHEAFRGAPVHCPLSGTVPGNTTTTIACEEDSVRTFQILNDPALTVLDRGHRTALSLGASGGTTGLTYAVTGHFSDELGLVKLPAYETNRYQTQFGIAPPDWMQQPQRFKQWGITSNIGMRLGSQADLTFTVRLDRTEQQNSSLQSQLGTLMSTYFDPASGLYYSGTSDGVGSILDAYYTRSTAGATQFTNGVNLNYRPRSWLTVTADAGLDVITRADQVFIPTGVPAVSTVGNSNDTIGSVQDGQGRSVVSTVNLRANAKAPLGRGFVFNFAAGANYTGTSANDLSGGSVGLAPGTSLQGGTIRFLRPQRANDATFGWYAEPSIGNSRFNFSSGLRLDGGSSYGANVSGLQLPTFPKLGFSYLLSDEPWFPLKDLVQSLRVRVSYGRASRQPGPTDRLRLYQVPEQLFGENQIVTGITLLTLGNTEVRPERSGEFEGGFDADLWDNRITLSLSGYRKTTDDALLKVAVAPEIYGDGVTTVKNIGRIRNTGLEVTAGAQLVRSGPVTWGARVQLSQNRNVVVNLAPGVAPFYSATGDALAGRSGGGLRVAPGYPLFGRWSRPITGYADANGDGILQAQEVQLGDTAVYMGSTLPTYQAVFATTLALWRGALTLDAGFAYDNGLTQTNAVAAKLAPFSRGQNDPTASIAEQLATADLLAGTDYNWIQTVNTLRFNSLSVRYRMPAPVARRLGAQQLDIAVQGGNLGLWTNYRGLDPNVNAFTTGNAVTDTGILPQPRTWQVRVSATY